MILRFRVATTWMNPMKGAGGSALHVLKRYLKLEANAAISSAATLTKLMPLV
jgi:hypothetical protein